MGAPYTLIFSPSYAPARALSPRGKKFSAPRARNAHTTANASPQAATFEAEHKMGRAVSRNSVKHEHTYGARSCNFRSLNRGPLSPIQFTTAAILNTGNLCSWLNQVEKSLLNCSRQWLRRATRQAKSPAYYSADGSHVAAPFSSPISPRQSRQNGGRAAYTRDDCSAAIAKRYWHCGSCTLPCTVCGAPMAPCGSDATPVCSTTLPCTSVIRNEYGPSPKPPSSSQ
jgi:hypothetical protein